MQEADVLGRSNHDFRVLVGELELSSAVDGTRTSKGYASADVLIRLHGEPLGLVTVPIIENVLLDVEIVERAWITLEEQIKRHCQRDGVRMPAGADDLQPVASAACSVRRRYLREHGPMVSIVIPTRDRAEMLVGCLATLLQQDYPRFEIIVVNNAPRSLATARAVRTHHGADDRVRYVREDRAGISFARNRGIAAARGEIVAFTDDDVRVDPGWLTALATPFVGDPVVACATGLVMPAEMETRAQRWTEEFGGFNKGYEPRVWDLRSGDDLLFPYAAGRFGSGQSMAFEARFLRQTGGFNTALGIGSPAMGGEDLAAMFGVMISGRRLAYVPDALVWHIHRRDVPSLRRQLFTYGVGLSAYLTGCVVERPQRLFDLLPRVPAGIRHLLSSKSAKNARKSATYPTHLTLLELVGFLYGPIAYARGRVRAAHLRRSGAAKSAAGSRP